jgi:hypothetical protein
VCACCGAGAPRQCLRVFLSISECFAAYWTVCSPCDGYGACQVLKRFPPCADANGEQAAIHAPAQQAAARVLIAAIGRCHGTSPKDASVSQKKQRAEARGGAPSPTHQVNMPWGWWVVVARISRCSLCAFFLFTVKSLLSAVSAALWGRAGAGAGSAGCGNLAHIPGEHAPGVTGLGGPDF